MSHQPESNLTTSPGPYAAAVGFGTFLPKQLTCVVNIPTNHPWNLMFSDNLQELRDYRGTICYNRPLIMQALKLSGEFENGCWICVFVNPNSDRQHVLTTFQNWARSRMESNSLKPVNPAKL